VDSGNPRAWRGGTIPRRDPLSEIIPLAGKGEGNFWGSLKFPEEVPPASPVEILLQRIFATANGKEVQTWKPTGMSFPGWKKLKERIFACLEKIPLLWSEGETVRALQRQGAADLGRSSGSPVLHQGIPERGMRRHPEGHGSA